MLFDRQNGQQVINVFSEFVRFSNFNAIPRKILKCIAKNRFDEPVFVAVLLWVDETLLTI